jgi:hypothetical protein
MDKKRYQVFVSSTFVDLPEERQAVFQMLMKMDCIPAGMELFPAADEEQFEFIMKVIDDCDYYIVIIGGRYGSLTTEGVSYTEKEYDYAIQRGIKVIGLLHRNPDKIPAGKTEVSPEAREKLAAFRTTVSQGRLIDHWETPDQLKAATAIAMVTAMKMYPAVGWVRADQVAKVQALKEVIELRKENDVLKAQLSGLRANPQPAVQGIAGLNESVTLNGEYRVRGRSGISEYPWKATLTWRELFGLIAPQLMKTSADSSVQDAVARAGFSQTKEEGSSPTVDNQAFLTVRIQFIALDLVSVRELPLTTGGRALFWTLTEAGEQLMLEIRVVRSATSEGQ